MEFSPAEEIWFQELKERKENKNIQIGYVNEHQLRLWIRKHKVIKDEFFRGEDRVSSYDDQAWCQEGQGQNQGGK